MMHNVSSIEVFGEQMVHHAYRYVCSSPLRVITGSRTFKSMEKLFWIGGNDPGLSDRPFPKGMFVIVDEQSRCVRRPLPTPGPVPSDPR